MKFYNEVEINQPIEKIISLLEDPSSFPKWYPGFTSMEPIDGPLGQEGSTALWKFKTAGIKVELIERITKRNLPHELHFTYTGKGLVNIQENYFTTTGVNGTKWILTSEYSFTGATKLFAWMMPGIFKKQTQKFLEQFKAFAEKEG
jgi:carbon monoxide dehydrogenase subunit G